MAYRQDISGKLEVEHPETSSWVPVVAQLQPRTSAPIEISDSQYQLFEDLAATATAIVAKITELKAETYSGSLTTEAIQNKVADIQGYIQVFTDSSNSINSAHLPAVRALLETIRNYSGNNANTSIGELVAAKTLLTQIQGNTNNAGVTLISEATAIKNAIDTVEGELGLIKNAVDGLEANTGNGPTTLIAETTAIKGMVDGLEADTAAIRTNTGNGPTTLIAETTAIKGMVDGLEADTAAIRAASVNGANTLLTRLTELRDCFDWAVPLSINSGSAVLNAVTGPISSSVYNLSANALTLMLQWYATTIDISVHYVVEFFSSSGATALGSRCFYARNMNFVNLPASANNFAGAQPEVIETSGAVQFRIHTISVSSGAVSCFAREIKTI